MAPHSVITLLPVIADLKTGIFKKNKIYFYIFLCKLELEYFYDFFKSTYKMSLLTLKCTNMLPNWSLHF
jgi:hypothetical protein